MKNLLRKKIWSSLQFTETEETINDRYNAACYSLKRKIQEMTYLRLTKSFKLKFICSVNRSMQITRYKHTTVEDFSETRCSAGKYVSSPLSKGSIVESYQPSATTYSFKHQYSNETEVHYHPSYSNT